MIKLSSAFSRWFGLLLLVSIALSGCISLEADITPPPAETPLEQAPATPLPSPTPAQETPLPTESLAPEELEGEIIIVNVIDHTGGSLVEEGLVVELAGFESFELVYQDAESLTSGDRVTFRDAPFLEGRIYFASISYGGAIYRSEIAELEAEQNQLELTIQIFETTASTETLIIDRVHLIADFPQPDYVQVAEIYIVSNLGESTVVAENPGEASVYFPLPAEAESIEFENGALGGRFLLTGDGFGDTVSIPPGIGVYQVLVYYRLPIQRGRLNFAQEMPYPVQAVTIMTPAGEAVVKGSSLEDQGIQAIADGSVQIYSGAGYDRGDSLEFRLTVQAEPASLPVEGLDFLPRSVIIGAGALGGLIFLVGVWLMIRRRTDLTRDEHPGEGGRADQILDSIIALDDLYQGGEIAEKDYLNKRQALKAELAALEDDLADLQ